eukprot:scaffold238830_cov52-Attheya_sp.AAC.1
MPMGDTCCQRSATVRRQASKNIRKEQEKSTIGFFLLLALSQKNFLKGRLLWKSEAVMVTKGKSRCRMNRRCVIGDVGCLIWCLLAVTNVPCFAFSARRPLKTAIQAVAVDEDNRVPSNDAFFSPPSTAAGDVALQMKQSPRASPTMVHLAIAGVLATVISDAALHPVDCLKTLQQSDEGYGLSMLDGIHQIFATKGLLGFYTGLGTYVVSDGIAGALKFVSFRPFKFADGIHVFLIALLLCSYEGLKKKAHEVFDDQEAYMGIALFLCAALAFVASSVAIVPGELLKQRMQMGQYDDLVSGVNSIWQTDGLGGFFAGYLGVCLRDIPYTALELGLYDNLKSCYLKIKNPISNKDGSDSSFEHQPLTQMDEILAAALTGGITGYVTTPFDTIKTKLMVDHAHLYAGFFDCLTTNVNEHGMSTLFQGGLTRILWIMPFTAIYLPLYDIFKRKLSEEPQES